MIKTPARVASHAAGWGRGIAKSICEFLAFVLFTSMKPPADDLCLGRGAGSEDLAQRLAVLVEVLDWPQGAVAAVFPGYHQQPYVRPAIIA